MRLMSDKSPRAGRTTRGGRAVRWMPHPCNKLKTGVKSPLRWRCLPANARSPARRRHAAGARASTACGAGSAARLRRPVRPRNPAGSRRHPGTGPNHPPAPVGAACAIGGVLTCAHCRNPALAQGSRDPIARSCLSGRSASPVADAAGRSPHRAHGERAHCDPRPAIRWSRSACRCAHGSCPGARGSPRSAALRRYR